MHSGHYLFTQLTMFLPQRYFGRLVDKYEDRTRKWSFSHWSHLLVLMFGQLIGCSSLRELTDITVIHGKKSYHLRFGKNPVTRNTLSKANSVRGYRIFEEFAFHMVSLVQKRRITRGFELYGRFHAVDPTTIDLCMSMFEWAHFRSTKSGVRIQIHVAIITYCFIAIVEHDFKLGRPVVEAMRSMGSALLVKDTIQKLFEPLAREQANGDKQ